jgi:hypothetical protein
MDKLPKSYLPESEKAGYPPEQVALLESRAARLAGDEEVAWDWLALADLPAYALKTLKRTMGADFVREKGFPLEKANRAYGAGWLEA